MKEIQPKTLGSSCSFKLQRTNGHYKRGFVPSLAFFLPPSFLYVLKNTKIEIMLHGVTK
jgi:hypothetical protein